MTSSLATARAAAAPLCKEFIDFVNAACSPFHCVQEVRKMLTANGYSQLKETDGPWKLVQGGKYFVTRNQSTIVAFTMGGKFETGNGIKLVGAHTDSPNLALKPKTFSKKEPYVGVGVQTYGGGLWHTWFDRDLTVAGRVIVKNGDTKLESRLVHVKKPILRIPNLAIHLSSADERTAFKINKETQLVPMIATHVMAELEKTSEATEGRQSTALLRVLSEELGCAESDIVDFDLSVVDTQDAVIGGAYDEFFFSPRLDNLLSSFAAVKAMVNTDASVAQDTMVRMSLLFDHEEIGSASSHGAAGSLLTDVVERINAPSPSLRPQCVAKSFFLSVDGAHGVHPNYSEKHEAEHKPSLHKGPVIKYNANVRYATTGYTAAVLQALAKGADIPLQKICVRNDSPCGSTIGPIVTTLSGVRGVDLGNAMLSMHSIREQAGTIDLYYLTNLIAEFFEKFETIEVDKE